MPLATQALAGLKPSYAPVWYQQMQPYISSHSLSLPLDPLSSAIPYLQFRAEGRRNIHLGHYPCPGVVRKEQLSCEADLGPFCSPKVEYATGSKCLKNTANIETAEAGCRRERSGGRRGSNDYSMAPPIAKHGLNAAEGWSRRAKDDTL